MNQQIDPTYRKLRKDGYVYRKAPGHPRADDRNRVAEHILIAEKAVGFYLPRPIEIHHVNEIKPDNRNENLVICPDHAYHILLHRRRSNLKSGIPIDALSNSKIARYEIDKSILFKSCPSCALILPVANFSRASSSSSGLGTQCRICVRENRKAYSCRPEIQSHYASEEFKQYRREYKSRPEVKRRANELRRIHRRQARAHLPLVNQSSGKESEERNGNH